MDVNADGNGKLMCSITDDECELLADVANVMMCKLDYIHTGAGMHEMPMRLKTFVDVSEVDDERAH